MHSLHFLLVWETDLPSSEGEWALLSYTGAESLLARLFDQKEWRGWSCPRQKTLGQMETRLYTWICCRLGSARLVAGSPGCSLLIEYPAEVVAAWNPELQEFLDL